MLPSLIILEILILSFYASKGLFKEKIRGYWDLLKNKKTLDKKYFELESKKIISDKVLINSFSEKIFVTSEVASNIQSDFFNSVISFMCKAFKKIL